MRRTSTLKKTLLTLAVFGVVSFGYGITAQADPVPVGALLSNGIRSTQGNGFGVVLPVLSLQQTPN